MLTYPGKITTPWRHHYVNTTISSGRHYDPHKRHHIHGDTIKHRVTHYTRTDAIIFRGHHYIHRKTITPLQTPPQLHATTPMDILPYYPGDVTTPIRSPCRKLHQSHGYTTLAKMTVLHLQGTSSYTLYNHHTCRDIIAPPNWTVPDPRGNSHSDGNSATP